MTKKNLISAKKVYSICFLALMVILFYYTVHNFLYESRTDINGVAKEAENVSLAELYPFENTEGEVMPKDIIDLGFVSKYAAFVDSVKSVVEDYSSTNKLYLSKSKNIQYLFSKLTFNDVFMYRNNTYVKSSNGYTVGYFPYCPSPKSMENILDFSSWLNNKNIQYLTLIAADKPDDSISEFPKGVEHGYTRMIEEYKSFLDKNKLFYIESKNTLLEKNKDFYSWFFKNDIHWNVHAGLAVAQETARTLNDELSIPTDKSALKDSNYKLYIYPNSLFGNLDCEIGKTHREDMEVLYPKTKTNFHIEIPTSGIDKTGSFENTLINQSKLSPKASFYSAFLYGDHPLIKIENNNCKNGTRVLFIKLSFADTVCPYLANAVQYVDMIDPRYFDGSIRSYIEQTKPDCVIFCMGVPTKYDEYYLHLK